MRHWALILAVLLPGGLVVGVDQPGSEAHEPHRSPMDLALVPASSRAITANYSAHTISLIDLDAGKVITEARCGRRPCAVACSRDASLAAVCNLWSATVSLFAVDGATLRHLRDLEVGPQPRGVCFGSDKETLYVAVAGADEVLELATGSGEVRCRWPAPREPRRLVLSPDGRHLVVACARSGEVRCISTGERKEVWARYIYDAFNLHGLTISPDGQETVAAFVHHRGNPITKHNIDHGWALDNRLARLPLAFKPDTPYRALALDVHGKAVGDPNAVAFNARGDRLVLSAGGTGEVLCFMGPEKLWSPGDAGDFMDIDLEQDGARLRRVPVGGRPVALGFVEGSELVAVANYLLDSVQLIDTARGEVLRQIPLGGPQTISLERRGEAIFYDAKRSHHQWFSCHTCHTDGHTSGRLFDTLNDDSYGNAKLTPSLRGVARTGPYTWHGWQEHLEDAVHKSLVDTMFGKQQPTRDDVLALTAFLATLDHPPKPRQDAAPVNNGRELFQGKAGCVRCHGGEQYATPRNFALRQAVDDNSGFELWNPPSLRGVVDRGPFLHNGRAETLDELLRVYHLPEKLGGDPLSIEERADLIAFLKSL